MSSRRNINDQNGEKEKEELKKQLSDLDLYDDGMTAEEMRERLTFVNESKREAIFSTGNISGSSSDVIEAVLSPTSPPVDNRTTLNLPTKVTGKESTSPDAIDDSYRNRWSQPTDNDSTDEALFDVLRPANVNVADAVRTRKVLEDSPNTRYPSPQSPIRETNLAMGRNHSFQDMKTYLNPNRLSKSMDSFNILDCKVSPNDVPLKSRFPIKPRPKIQIVDGLPVIPDEISAQKLAYLTEMANLAHSWKVKLVCNEFSWGPPIKAGIANGSLDKFPHQDDIPDDPEPPGQSCIITREVSASGYSLRPTPKSTNHFDFHDSDDELFETTKCKKTPKILSNQLETPRQSQPKKNQSRGTSEETSKSNISLVEVIDDKVGETNSTPNGRKRLKSTSPEYPEKNPVYPRRVVPPVPSTPKSRKKILASTTRTKKRTAPSECDTDNMKPKRTTSGLSDKEIQDLISDDEEPKIVDCAVPPTKRLNQGVEYLKKAQQAADEEKQKREKEAALIADQETREKKERARRRITERDERIQQQEAHEKSTKEREDRYRNLTSTIRSQGHVAGTFQKRIELESEGVRPTNSMEVEMQGVDDGDMFPDGEYGAMDAVEAVEQTACPICGKQFSLVEIENHAANCDDFAPDKPTDDIVVNALPSTSRRPSLLGTFSCEICGLTSRYENVHKQHFSQCVNSLTVEGSKSNESVSSTWPIHKLSLTTHDSDDEISQTGNISSPTTDRKKTARPLSRRRRF